jgi:hypothetical protein
MATKNNNVTALENARIRNKELAAKRADLWIKEANDRINELTRLFITLSTIVLTLSLPIISNPSILKNTEKYLLITSWILGLTSITIGAISVWIDSKYYEKLARVNNKSELIWSQMEEDFSNMDDQDKKNQSEIKLSSSFVPFFIQAGLVAASLALLTIVGIIVLFRDHPQNNDIQNNKTPFHYFQRKGNRPFR